MSIGQEKLSKGGYDFVFETKLAGNPVEDQASTGTCWSFSTGSFLEMESVRLGGSSVNLSEMFFVRCNYVDKARLYLRLHGTSNFDEGSLSHDVMHILRRYGAMPEAIYSGLTGESTRHNHSRLKKDLKKYLDDLISSGTIPEDWFMGFNAILDLHLGVLPAAFEYQGTTYDPISFAKSVLPIIPSDYVSITSFSHHDPYSNFVLEIPDNYRRSTYLNVPLADLLVICNEALKQGQTVVWDCDVSEKGFSARQGLAIVPDETMLEASKQAVFDAPTKEAVITPDLRQLEFDNYGLTDDHLMHIVGSAQDQEGTKYYYVKNSWGQGVGLDGYLLASSSYFQLNTIAIMVHKDVIPREIKDKLKITNTNHQEND